MPAIFKNIRVIACVLLILAAAGCSGRKDLVREAIPWEQIPAGLEKTPGSPEYMVSIISLARSWQQHGPEGAAMWTKYGLELIGLGANGAIGGVSTIVDVPPDTPAEKLVPTMMAALTQAAEKGPDDVYRNIVLLLTAWNASSDKNLQPLVDLADVGTSEWAPAVRLCLAPVLVDMLTRASGSLPSERGRVILELVPGWPSPPTRDITQTLFPANLSRLSRWIADGVREGGRHGKAWKNVAARMERGLGPRMFDLPAVVDAEPRQGTPISSVSGRFTPIEIAHVKAGGVDFALRPVIGWQDSFMTMESGAATWSSTPRGEGAAPTDISIETLGQRAAALHELSLKLEKAVYPALVGTAMGERTGKSILVVVDPDADGAMLVRALSTLAVAGYSDFRLVPPGAPGMVNPVMDAHDTGSLSRDRTARVFLTARGASLFPNPVAEIAVDFMPAGVEPLPSPQRVNGLFIPWDSNRGFSASLAQAFSSLGLSAAGRVDVAEITLASPDVPAMMIVDAVSELQAAPGVPFSKIERYFPGLTCPQGRSCPGVVPVLGVDFRAPAAVR